jgi:Protein of unknown function (DUF3037)
MENLCKFSVLRFVPDEIREESVNIGIALFIDDQVTFHLAPSLSKAQSLFPGLSLAELRSLPETLPRFLEPLLTSEEKNQAIQRMAPINASSLGEVFPAPNEQYVDIVERLLRKYVYAPRTRPLPDPNRSALRDVIATTFKNLGVYSKHAGDINAHKVVSRFPVTPHGDLVADFAYKNGHLRLAQVVDFRVSADTMATKLAESCRKAITLDQARRHVASDVERFVIYALPESPEQGLVDSALSVLTDYSDVVLNANSEQDLDRFSSSFAQTM